MWFMWLVITNRILKRELDNKWSC